MRKDKVEQNKGKKNKKFNLKSYIREFLIFADKKLIKTIGILLVVAILLVAISISPMLEATVVQECEGTCTDGISIMSEYGSKLTILLITLIAGIVPYVYAPIVGFVGYVLNEVSTLSYIIKMYGALPGIGIGIIPLILNIITICIVTALGIYICRATTVGYKISNIKNMNLTNFRIKFYEAVENDNKSEALTKSRDEKIKKLEDKKEKINYLQILNVGIIVCIIQFISVLIQKIML